MPPSEEYVDLTPPPLPVEQPDPLTPPAIPPPPADDLLQPNLVQRAAALDGSKQPLDALLTSIAALTFGSDSFIYGTGSDTAAAGTVTSFARTLLDDADAATARTTLGISGNLALVSDSASAIVFSFAIGGTTYYLQAGTGSLGANSTDTITFPQAFATRAFCVVGGGDSDSSREGDITGYAVSTTAASIKNSSGAAGDYCWIALGY